ncbi:MAG: hypothetical protein ACYDAY_07310 [Candidatus Dormibacteria bacterium]
MSGSTLWLLARTAGLGAYLALCLGLVSGMALRTSILAPVASNRAVRGLHDFTQALWLPLGLVHVEALLLDHTARLGLGDVVIPFRAPYGPLLAAPFGTLGIGLGTLALDLVLLVAVTSWFRSLIRPVVWTWIHRTAYLAFGLTFLHALMAGTDFSLPAVSALTWSTAAVLLVLALARLRWGRLAG